MGLSVTLATMKPTPMPVGEAGACLPKPNGKLRRPIFRSRETLRKAITSIQIRTTDEDFRRCLATHGSGLVLPILATPATGNQRARLANTTENSCATSSCCAEAPAQHPSPTFAQRTGIFFLRIHVGSSWG